MVGTTITASPVLVYSCLGANVCRLTKTSTGFLFLKLIFSSLGISVHKQYSLLDTIFNYKLDAGEVVGFGDLSIDIFLEVQNETYS